MFILRKLLKVLLLPVAFVLFFIRWAYEEYKAHVEAKLKREEEKKSLEDQSLFKNDYVEA